MAERPVSRPVLQPQLFAELLQYLGDQYGPGFWGRLRWYLERVLFAMKSWFFDLEYNTAPRWLVDEALDEWRSEALPGLVYQGEYMDCDDFAMKFKVWLQERVQRLVPSFNAVGIALGYVYDETGRLMGGHAWNLVVTTEDGVVFVEPQLGDYIEWRPGEGGVTTEGWRYRLVAVVV